MSEGAGRPDAAPGEDAAEAPRIRLRVLLIDDEAPARDKLRSMLVREPDVEVVGECATGLEALEWIRRDRPDLVFLDIEMPQLDGLSMLTALGSENVPAVVFVTAYDRYAIEAFEVHALDYLLKPFDQDRLTRSLSHVRRILETAPGVFGTRVAGLIDALRHAPEFELRLVVKDGDRVTFIEVGDIDWVQAAGNYVEIHAGPERHLLRETLKALEARLDGRRFVRIHRSALVNLDRIRDMRAGDHGEYHITLTDGRRLKAGRGASALLRQRLAGRESR